jgi:hypothetical protein
MVCHFHRRPAGSWLAGRSPKRAVRNIYEKYVTELKNQSAELENYYNTIMQIIHN